MNLALFNIQNLKFVASVNLKGVGYGERVDTLLWTATRFIRRFLNKLRTLNSIRGEDLEWGLPVVR